MDLYHGSDLKSLEKIQVGKIDVKLGGGELGRGFYCGDLLYRAKAWSFNKYNSTKIVKLIIDDDDLLNLSPLLLNKSEATQYREEIKRNGQTRSYLFNENAVWSPVVGLPSNDFNQVKWESKESEDILNSNNISKQILGKMYYTCVL